MTVLLVKVPDDGRPHVVMTVVCDKGHVIDQFLDSITEKYPFYCNECDDDKRDGKYPWSITAQIVGTLKV